MPKVFVYGTLLSGEGNNKRFLQTSKLLSKGTVYGFSMYDLGSFPACIPDPINTEPILGEIWEVTDEVFQSLDSLEGYPNFYNRVEVDTYYGKAWMYINERLSRYQTTLISSGSWKQHLKEKYG